jgi:hypothetical protein
MAREIMGTLRTWILRWMNNRNLGKTAFMLLWVDPLRVCLPEKNKIRAK